MKTKLLGIDLAKNIFQVCALNQANKVIFNRKVRRAQLHAMIANTPPTLVAMGQYRGTPTSPAFVKIVVA